MAFTIGSVQLWVNDQDRALEFYTTKLGMEVRTDVTVAELGNFRWLTVGPVGQEDVSIVLMEPMMDDATADQVRDLTAKGFSGTVFLITDDCQGTYEELTGRGVEFVQTPEVTPYGIDCAFRDPDGNHIRLTQLHRIGGV